MKLIQHNYGKAKVRVLKVFRAGAIHSIKELDVQVMLQGDFRRVLIRRPTTASSWRRTRSKTPSMFWPSKTWRGDGGVRHRAGRTFSQNLQTCQPRGSQFDGTLLEPDFRRRQTARAFVSGEKRGQTVRQNCLHARKRIVESGIEELFILKSTASGFENFLRDEFTTLPETATAFARRN
jgi:urate oxidase